MASRVDGLRDHQVADDDVSLSVRSRPAPVNPELSPRPMSVLFRGDPYLIDWRGGCRSRWITRGRVLAPRRRSGAVGGGRRRRCRRRRRRSCRRPRWRTRPSRSGRTDVAGGPVLDGIEARVAAERRGHQGEPGGREHGARARAIITRVRRYSGADDGHLRDRGGGVHRFAPVRAAVRAGRRSDRARQLRPVLPARRQGAEPGGAARASRGSRSSRATSATPTRWSARSRSAIRRWSSTWRRWRACARRWPSRRATPTSTSPGRSACSTPSRAHGVARFVFGSSSSVYGARQPAAVQGVGSLPDAAVALRGDQARQRADAVHRPPALRARRHLPALLHRVTARASGPIWRSTSSRG